MGGVEVLTLREVPAPVVNPGQILVRTVASTINPLDIKMRGKDLPFPVTFGSDVAGIVVESDVADYRPGDRVMGLVSPKDGVGAWSDLVPLDQVEIAHAPASVSLAEAATIPLAGLTALQTWDALTLSPGARVLVLGAAGGIGGFAVQFAVQAGMKVDALVSGASQVDSARSLGAGLVTDDPGALPVHAYDAVFDPIVAPLRGIDVREFVAADAQYVAVGRDESKVPGGMEVTVDDDPAGLRRIAELVDAGSVALRIAGHYPVQQFRAAHAQFEAGGLSGKVVLHF
jgi:NADPH:quinone reductase-like Zn-dependent oxidoreductase